MSIPYLGVSSAKKERPIMQMAPNFRLGDHVREITRGGKTIYEFIGSDDFGPEWYNRVRFEVDQGRERVPLLYEPFYDIINDGNLPETQTIKNWGSSGVILEEIEEGGEVKFVHIESAETSVTQRQYGVGLEYTKRLIKFNQLWEVARIERRVGEAHNALLNHLHLWPILNQTYGAANQTAAVSSGDSVTENWFLTIENAVVNSIADTTNPRNGPFALLVHPAQSFMLQRAMSREPQQGFKLDSNASQFIQTIVGYNGWSGRRGKKTVTYPGVTLGKGYLVNLAYRDEDFISLVSQSLEQAQGNADVSRFIEEQIVWDTFLGVYANPLRAVEEITFPS